MIRSKLLIATLVYHNYMVCFKATRFIYGNKRGLLTGHSASLPCLVAAQSHIISDLVLTSWQP